MPDKELSKRVISRLIKADGRKNVEIAKDLDISSQRLGQYKNGNRFPDAEFIHLWQEKFGQNIMDLINSEETNVSYGTSNGTHAKESTDNNKNEMSEKNGNDAALGLAYKIIMEGGTEYMLIARDLLKDKHRLVAIETLERDERIINRLLDENERLRLEAQKLQTKLPEVQKTQ